MNTVATDKPLSLAEAMQTERQSQRIWRSMYFFNLYRIALSSLFVLSQTWNELSKFLGSQNPALFESSAVVYLALSVAALFAIRWRWPNFHILSHSLTIIDITALTLLMHASGGVESGLGMLLIVAIAGNSLLLVGRTASFYAAVAAIAVLIEQLQSHFIDAPSTNFTQAGILGASLFATAYLAHVLSQRLRESEALAEQRGVDLANMAQLNEHVIQRMQSGLIVVDAENRIILSNESARLMLGIATDTASSLATLNLALGEQLQTWRAHRLTSPTVFTGSAVTPELLPQFTDLGHDRDAGVLIFLEDTARLAQQAQQMKLASLGRLTASIAHEIRNPLGAISHAEQLLSESAEMPEADKRLMEIIHNNASRVNHIVNNVLQLSRRHQALPSEFSLQDWLKLFVEEFLQGEQIDTRALAITVMTATAVPVRFDPSQLHQVLTNLCQNGLRYSAEYPDNPKVELQCGYLPGGKRPYLDVIDHGPGIDPQVAQDMFEPFFTTEARGSGLGLYIARELCECNQARLGYSPTAGRGSRFRIEFAAL